MHPFEAASFSDWLRALRSGRSFRLADAFVVALVLYAVIIIVMRFSNAFLPWTMEGDWKQWIWQYHRYYTDGAFPPGHVITDYQFRVQPPLYYAAMASLSHVVHPGVAARALAILAWVLMLVGAYRATTRLSHWVMGLVAVVLVSHDAHLFIYTTGGYPRSFGPALVLWLLDAWLARRHTRALALLVVMAGLYPSVLPPCGLAYGTWTAVAALREGTRAWLKKTGTLAAAAVACAATALLQNVLALDWWGGVIKLQEAEQLTALHEGGRMVWVPHGDYFEIVTKWLWQPFEAAGALALYDVLPWHSAVPQLALAMLIPALAAVVVLRRRRLPWEPLALIAATLVVYFVARELAFRLYLPARVVQHVLPVTVIVLLPALAWHACGALVTSLRRAIALCLVPLFVLAGDGFLIPKWGSYPYRAGHLGWIERSTAVEAQFAGDIATCDLIPYFSARQVYVNWTMSHPFRLGYWHEMERRLTRVHEAMYAVDRSEVLRFLEEEHIDYLVIAPVRFDIPDSGRKLFHPIRDPVLALWRANRAQGFVLRAPPVSAIAYSDEQLVILDAAKLRAAWQP